MSDRSRPAAYENLTLEHPALSLLADMLRATRGPAAPEDIAKLLGHALRATGYRLVPAEPGSALVRVSPAILSELVEHGSEPVHVLAVTDNGDGTHDMLLRSPDAMLPACGEVPRGAPGCTCGTPPFAPPEPSADCPHHGGAGDAR